jgi:hypothetical protein
VDQREISNGYCAQPKKNQNEIFHLEDNGSSIIQQQIYVDEAIGYDMLGAAIQGTQLNDESKDIFS